MLNSRRDDLTSVERYVDQSRRLFIRDVALRQRRAINSPSSVDKATDLNMFIQGKSIASVNIQDLNVL